MAMHPPITDDQILSLVPRCQRGEAAAFEVLYDLYADRLYRYLLARTGDGEIAADLTTEVFVRVIERIDGFRLNRSRPAASTSAWLYRIAANLTTDAHRARQRLPVHELSADWPAVMLEADPPQRIQQEETLGELAQALETLSEDQRLVLVGKFAEEMSNAEIAAWLGKSEGAVKSLQHRALRSLGRLLAPRGHRDLVRD
jgi:RNA polymerase sigma-70 factor (ECF subfamily)